MELSDWKNESGLTYEQIGSMLGVDKHTVYRWAARMSRPEDEEMYKKIYILSGKKVTANDFYGIPDGMNGKSLAE